MIYEVVMIYELGDSFVCLKLIHFIIKKRVKYGQSVFVCGDIAELGGWNPEKAFRLKWNEVNLILLRVTSGVVRFFWPTIFRLAVSTST